MSVLHRIDPRSPAAVAAVLLAIALLAIGGAGDARAHAPVDARLAELAARIASRPGDPEPYLERARALHERGAWDDALADCERAGARGAGDLVVALTRAELLLDAGRPADARRALDRLLAERLDDLRALRLRGRALVELGLPSRAAHDLARFVDRARGASPDVYLRLVRALSAAGRHDEALARAAEGLARLGPVTALRREADALESLLGRDTATRLRARASSSTADTTIPAVHGAVPAVDASPAPSAAATPATVIRGPYLQRGAATSVTVRWRTDVATDSRVSYGPAPDDLRDAVDDPALVTEHELVLTGLDPASVYHYAVGTVAETLAGGDGEHHFETAPLAGSAGSTRIWVIGDSGTADVNARAVRDAYRSFTGERRTDLWLMLGDNAYTSGTDDEYQRAVFELYPELLRTVVLWPTLGNHDGLSADSATQTGPYYDVFTLPSQGEAGGATSGTEAYYAFDHGDVHFVCLDSHGSDRSPGGAMLAWLEEDLAATGARWVIAFWHHPPYSKGSHDSDLEPQLIEMRENVLPILEAYGVDLVLAGHSHSYERSVLVDGHHGPSSTLEPAMILDSGDGRVDGDGVYRKPTAGLAPREGAVYAVAGSSGRITPGTLDHPVMHVAMSTLGSLVLDVEGLVLHGTFLAADGSVGDRFTLVKGDAEVCGDGVQVPGCETILVDGFESGTAAAWSSCSPGC